MPVGLRALVPIATHPVSQVEGCGGFCPDATEDGWDWRRVGRGWWWVLGVNRSGSAVDGVVAVVAFAGV